MPSAAPSVPEPSSLTSGVPVSMWLRIGNLGLRRKLLGAFGVVLAITVVLSAASYRAVLHNEQASAWVLHSQNVITDLNELLNTLYGVRTNYSSYLLTGETTWLPPYQTAREHYRVLMDDLTAETADNVDQQDRLRTIDDLVTTWFTETLDPTVASRQQSTPDNPANDPATAQAIEASRGQFSQIQGFLNQAIDDEAALFEERSEEAEVRNLALRRLLIFGTGGAVIVGVVLAWLIAGDIAGRAGRLTSMARQIAGGDFGQRLRFRRQDEIGQAATAFDQMTDTLQSTMRQLEQSAAEAQTERRRTGAVLNSTADGILTFLPDGTITESNPAAERMFAREADAFRGLHIDELLRCDPATPDQGPVVPLILPADHETQGARRTVLGCRADGATFPLEIAVSRMEDGADQYIGVVRDITERREAERKFQAQFRRAQRTRSIANAVLDAAGEGMILISPDRRITAVNRRFADLFQITITDVIDRSMQHFGADLDQRIGEAGQFREMLYASVGDSERRIEQTFTQIWPQRRELDMVSTPVSTRDGEHVGRVYAFRDVTRERELDRMKSEFVSMVSHELRTPLTSIKGYVDLLLEGEVGALTPDQQEFLEIVGSNAERLVSLINDILDISRIEAGRIALTMAPVDLPSLLERLVISFRPQIEAKRQRLVVDIAPSVPPARGDAERLTQIFANLISNAHKYTPAGGTLTIRAGAIGNRVVASVADTGIGLSQEEQEQLFTRFYRAQNRTTQEVGGTGLGLSITRSLVDLHGGTIAVESTPGKGSTFTVALPQAIEEVAAVGPTNGAHDAHGRILIVEDEPDIARLIRRYLERAGYEVHLASDAATALRIARETPLDLITLDVILPDTDGFTLLEWLKNDARTAGIPVIMLSMVADEGQGRSLGAVDYLVKPIREDALLQRISRLLASNRSGTVLVADDEADVRRLLARQLARAGYQVLEAENGEEAVEAATTQDLDAVFLDIRMPVLDGFNALKAIRAVRTEAELPIVMMTASPGAADAAQGMLASLGIADLLQKPISAEELARTIATSMRQEREVRT